MDSCNVRNSWQVSVKGGGGSKSGKKKKANFTDQLPILKSSSSMSPLDGSKWISTTKSDFKQTPRFVFGKDDMLQIQSKSSRFHLKNMYPNYQKSNPDFLPPSNRTNQKKSRLLSSHLPTASRARCLHQSLKLSAVCHAF